MFRLLHLTPLIVAFAFCLTSLPAAAQWVAPGRWGTADTWRIVVPGTWLVLRSERPTEPVSIHAEGDNNVGRIEMWCDPVAESSAMRLTAYYGNALRYPVARKAGDPAEPVVFIIDSQRFDRAVTYDFAGRQWLAQDMLDAPFLDAFAWGTRMELRNAADELVVSYRLNGSSAAREALRSVCGF